MKLKNKNHIYVEKRAVYELSPGDMFMRLSERGKTYMKIVADVDEVYCGTVRAVNIANGIIITIPFSS